MPGATTTTQNDKIKELLDKAIYSSYDHNTATMKLMKRVPTEEITSRGRDFVVEVGSNESYQSIAEGGDFPAAGVATTKKATVTYKRHFKSFDFTGDVLDQKNNNTIADEFQYQVKNATKQFDETQNYFLFGTGNGSLGTIDSVAGNDLTMLNTVAASYGARMVRAGQVLNAYDQSGSAYRSGNMTVASVARSTDIVSVDAAAASIASDNDDILVYKAGFGLENQGFAYHIAATSWLGLSRTTYPSLAALVYDQASAAPDWDMIDLALLQSRNIRGDNAPKYDYTLIGHPVTHTALRMAARSNGNTQFNAEVSGTAKADLGIRDIALNGMTLHEDSSCAPSDMWGLKLDTWYNEELMPRQLYKHNDGNILIQSQGSVAGVYADKKEGRIFCRNNIVCKEPYKNFRIKNINFDIEQVRIQRA
jgi:hypothetical protein